MAKKSKESGPGTFMILTLVFFVLATVILGITTYLGFAGQAQLEDEAKKAKAESKTLQARVDDEMSRKIVNRIANGTATAEDLEAINGAARANAPGILDEYRMLTVRLGNAFPTKAEFQWPLVADLQAGGAGDGKPSPAPNKDVPAIAKYWAGLYKNAENRVLAAETARKKAEADAQTARADADKAKETFDAQVAKLTAQVDTKTKAMDDSFKALKTGIDVKAAEFKKAADEWAEGRAKLEEDKRVLQNEIKSLGQKIANLMNPDASDWEFKFRHWNPAKMAERMGKVTEKGGTFVSLQFDTRVSLVPGQTFVVIAGDTSLVEVLEQEKALEKKHHTVLSLGAREPFADNPAVKGTVEITDVTGAGYTARARITSEAAPIRNPISKGDQLFNMSLSSGQKEHVAFAGIIDLDGDGRPDNEQFIRILEKNNLVVDAYLDLKTGQVVKRGEGLDHKTKFLIVGSDAPLVGGVKAMVAEAEKKGVQQIDARMFLNLIGVKPPRNPAPPAYSSPNIKLGGEGALAPKDPDAAPMPPAVDPKKDEPKKE